MVELGEPSQPRLQNWGLVIFIRMWWLLLQSWRFFTFEVHVIHLYPDSTGGGSPE